MKILAHLCLLLLVVIAETACQGTIMNPKKCSSYNESNSFIGLNLGLGALPLLDHARSRSISAENPTGAKGKGGMAIPDPNEPGPLAASARSADDLGQGWKVKPFLRVNKGETVTLMDVDGPGVIQHIWMVEGISRAHVLRFFWDGEEEPSIEVPVPDFFAVGHEKFAPVNSLAVVVNPQNALNCYWPMPFKNHVKITFSNESDTDDLQLLAYQIDYAETEVPENAGYFHAQWRRARTGEGNPFVIVDGIKGKGRYVGTFLAWTQRRADKEWFGEGEIKFFLDGDQEFPTICGTGLEDYFCHSYGFAEVTSGPYVGSVLPGDKVAEKVLPYFWSLYRWHLLDPVCFDENLRITLQVMGWGLGGKYELLDEDIAAVSYWYQTEPHAQFPRLPSLAERKKVASGIQSTEFRIENAIECEDMKVSAKSPGLNAGGQRLTGIVEGASNARHLLVQATKPGQFVELSFPVSPQPGAKRVILHAIKSIDFGILQFTVNGQEIPGKYDFHAASPQLADSIDLGAFAPVNDRYIIKATVVDCNPAAVNQRYMFGLDCIVLEPVKQN